MNINELLEYSSWETKPESLKNFLDRVTAKGGWGNEAVEVGLWYAID